MAINKSDIFSTTEQRLASWAKVLGHPARILILRTLAEKKTCICGEIVEVLPLSQSTVSQHLKALKEAGLVEGTIDGVRSCYCINRKEFEAMTKAMTDFLNDLSALSKDDCC